MTPVEQLDYAVWPMLHAMTTRGLRVDGSALDAQDAVMTLRLREVL